MIIEIRSGYGVGPTELSAFDAALNTAGVANYNLIHLSSVIPPNSIVIKPKATEKPIVSGAWGDRLYVVMAENRTSLPGEHVWAGIGWVQDKISGEGLFVEHTGDKEEVVKHDIKSSLVALMKTRKREFGPIEMIVKGSTCNDLPVCSLVLAIYQAESWQ